MPFSRTWSEELVAEWLTLQGFVVVTGLPVGIGSRGGRKEADVVGARVIDGHLEIHHIEVGMIGSRLGDNETILKEKFSSARQNEVTKHFTDILGALPLGGYRCTYIASYIADKQMRALPPKVHPIEIKPLHDFLKKEVLPQLRKDYVVKERTPPEGLWLLHLLTYLQGYRLIREVEPARGEV